MHPRDVEILNHTGWTVCAIALVLSLAGLAFSWPSPSRPEARLTALAPYDGGILMHQDDTIRFDLVPGTDFAPGNYLWVVEPKEKRICFGPTCAQFVERLPDGGWRGVGFCP